ncbi:MAG: glutaminyl-peptide cyclotransferase [Acidimicrobiales bacterium]
MSPIRVRLLGVALIVVATALFIRSLPFGDDGEDVISDMIELTATRPTVALEAEPDDEDFPAIVDSAVRDPAERVAPISATFEVIGTTDHDPGAFTQGFELHDGRLFESTGLVGSSTLRELDPTTGEILRSVPVPGVFAEGMTVVDDEIVQITWTEGIAYRYDLESFDVTGTHNYDDEGWGICNDGARLVMSNGSPKLTFRDPSSFEVLDDVTVTFNGAPVERLNELECVGSTVWANIWLTPLIIEINPVDGMVLTVINAGGLRPPSTADNSGAVLNGIAHDPSDDTFLITGKLWPTAYRVEIER